MNIAIRRSLWTLDEWKNIVFTDESGIDNSGRYRRFVFRPRNQRFNPKYVFQAPNKSLRVNFFGWTSAHGQGELIFYRKMNSKVYCDCIAQMIPILRETFGHDEFKIIHHNARFSDSVDTQRFLRANDYQKYFIPHPTYSPDMNIIENLWGILKHLVKKHMINYGQVRRTERLKDLIEEKWQQIPSETIINTYKSLPKRMRQIVEAQGNLIKY